MRSVNRIHIKSGLPRKRRYGLSNANLIREKRMQVEYVAISAFNTGKKKNKSKSTGKLY